MQMKRKGNAAGSSIGVGTGVSADGLKGVPPAMWVLVNAPKD